MRRLAQVGGGLASAPRNSVGLSLGYSTLLETVRDVATSTLGVARCCGQLKRSFCYLELNPLAVFNESESTIGVSTFIARNISEKKRHLGKRSAIESTFLVS